MLAADLCYLGAPNETFGLAGILWLVSIGLLLVAAFVGSQSFPDRANELHFVPWGTWEIVILAGLFLVALLTRVWDLTKFPDNIYPDEIQTGTIATQSFIAPTGFAHSVFGTVWGGIELPALWFWIVSVFLKVGGSTLTMLRLPAALFGAATVLPLYGLIRGTWGRFAAMAGTAILAFSTSNVHYSRLALNNIVPQFFWAACFFLLLRGLKLRRPLDWALAGLLAGLSEYFYYATRLLPFILLMFIGYLLAVHWRYARQYLSSFILLAVGFFVGFGPLLFHFISHRNLYFGRGASLMTWSPHIPTTFQDLESTWKTIWPAICENLLGISTHGSQDMIFYAPLLLPAEAALLVLGVTLLLWHWRHPAAFLILCSGFSMLLVGGMLVANPSSVPPLINHWTSAFPSFYAALGVPIGAWMASGKAELPVRLRWVLPATLTIGLSLLGWLNLNFYFRRYYANPASLRSSAYRFAQQNCEIQTVQSRYQASLGPGYRVFTVGRTPPCIPDTARFLAGNQEWTLLTNPAAELPFITTGDKGLAFLFFPGSEQYLELTHNLYPGGADSDVKTRRGKHLFYTYVLQPTQTQAIRR
jgi:hypothetical protein